MKKVFIFISTIIVLFFISTSNISFAQSDTFYIEELDMSINIPLEYTTFTRSMSSTDPSLEYIGLTKIELLRAFKKDNVYLEAYSDNKTIRITMIDSQLNNFCLLNDTILNAIARTTKNEYEKSGINVDKYSIESYNQAKYIVFYCMTFRQYYTVYNNQAINIIISSTDNPSPEVTHAPGDYSFLIQSISEQSSIIKTVRFYNNPPTKKPNKQTNSFVYTDSDTGLTFTVPDNWEQKDLSKERKTVNAKFTSNIEEGLSILYGNSDIWSEMQESERKSHSRQTIDNSALSRDDIANMFDTTSNLIEIKTLGDKEYYRFTTTAIQELYGFSFVLPMTYFIHIENGYLYYFGFDGDNTNPNYIDFINLISSVKYPEIVLIAQSDVSSTNTISSDNKLPSNTYSKANLNDTLNKKILIVFFALFVYFVPILVYRYKIRKKPVTRKSALRLILIYTIIMSVIMIIISYMFTNGSQYYFANIFAAWICYRILISGKDNSVESNNDNQTDTYNVNNTQLDTSDNKNFSSKGTNSSGKSDEIDDERKERNNLLSNAQLLNKKSELDQIQSDVQIQEHIGNSIVNDQSVSEEIEFELLFCRKCGKKLIGDSQFCQYCGTKVIKY